MPRHDYRCPRCATILRDQYRSVVEGGLVNPPFCPNALCQDDGSPQRMVWIIPVPRMDLRTDGEGRSGATFQKFTMRDGRNQLVEIDSLSKLRQVERESEQLARNGEGQIVQVRAFAQDRSNRHTNVFGERPADAPQLTEAGKRRFGLQGGAQAIAATTPESEPDCPYGPGVNDSNTSALALED